MPASESMTVTNRFLATLFLTGGLLLGAIATVNFIGDPAGFFRSEKLERGVAEALVEGRYIQYVGPIPFRDRLVQKYVVANPWGTPDTIVLGSSRTWKIRADMLDGGRFFNHSVSAGTLEDYLGLFWFYEASGQLPRRVIIDAEPGILNKSHGSWRYAQVFDPFLRYIEKLGVALPPGRYLREQEVGPLSALVSLAYLRESWQLLVYQHRYPGGNLIYSDTDDSEGYVYRPDGSMKSRRADLDAEVGQVAAQVRRVAFERYITFLGWFGSLDPFYKKAFQAFVARLRKADVEVVFYFPPYHPVAHQAIGSLEKYAMVAEADRFFRDVAARYGIQTIGNYNPAVTRCPADEFIDAIHATEHCVRAVFKELKLPN